MAARVEPPEVAGHQPAVHDGLRGHLGIVEIMRHHRFAAHGDFARCRPARDRRCAPRIPGTGLPTVSGRNGSKSLRVMAVHASVQAVAIGDLDAKIVEKLQRGGLGECAADQQRPQLAAERLVNVLQQSAAEAKAAACRVSAAIDADERHARCAALRAAKPRIARAGRARGFSGSAAPRPCR